MIKTILSWLPFGSVPEISVSDLNKKHQASEVQIVDVRTHAEWKLSRIPGAINLPISRFTQANIRALKLDKEKEIVLICLSAHRSIPAVRQIKKLGFNHAVQLQGGMKSWWKAGNATENKSS